MAKAKANRPQGTTYVRIFGAWLRRHGFDEIDNQCRYRALLCLENEIAIEKWRATLSEKQRNRLNHPGAVWHAWKRATKAPSARRAVLTSRKASVGGRPICPTSDMIRRVAAAMREGWTSDSFALATIALRAAFRDRDELIALLDDTPHRPMPAAAAHVAA